MKRTGNIFRYIGLVLMAFTGISCIEDNLEPVRVLGSEVITLDISSFPETKAIGADSLKSEGHEVFIEHIDLFIFGNQAAPAGQNPESIYYERIAYSTANPEEKPVGVKKSQFVTDAEYDVYVIANSTVPEADFRSIASLGELKELTQADEFVHMSGLSGDGLPKNFLMDGRAFTEGGRAVLNPRNKESENIVMKAELARAASKFVVELYEGEDVEFENPDNSHVYHFRNLPYNTLLLSGGTMSDGSRLLRSTLPHQVNDYVIWNRDATGTPSGGKPNVAILGYAYEYDFSGTTPLDEHTSIIVNIPMKTYKDNGDGGKTETLYQANYYKIPLSKDRKFERNHFYRIRATVKAPGAQSSFEPVVVEDLTYDVIPWTEYMPMISVGKEENRPKYLQINTDMVKMYNVNEDNSTLTFASSSRITDVELMEAYYYNKHGVKTNVASEIMSNIVATADKNVLNGKINIFSPIVALTAAQRQEMIDALGTAPSTPDVTRPVNPVVPTVEKPEPDDYLPSNGWTIYSYEGTEPDYIFYVRYFYESASSRRRADDIKAQYDADYQAYLKYVEWENNPNKEALINEYQQAMKEYEAAYAEYNAYYEAVRRINATTEPSHQNTIRYLTFRVTNEQGLFQEFAVEQYPVIYITNSLGWYSYRKDFRDDADSPTTYEYRGDGIVSVSLTAWSEGGKKYWQNRYSTSRGAGYWFSKSRPQNYSLTGNLRTQAYGYSNSGTGSLQTGNASNNSDNLRLYHVNVTTTSGDYIIGRPKMKEMRNEHEVGAELLLVTDPSEDNKKLVSPSFMIASRLGYFITSNNDNLGDSDMNDEMRLEVFRKHCANYVEVHGTSAADRKVYDNWRLPTEAELKIIMNIQGRAGQNADAIDYLLNAVYYFGAHGPVYNSKNDDNAGENINSSSKSVRCVRDEY